MLRGGRRRTILKQGHGVRGVTQRRSLNLEHKLVYSEAPVPPHLLSGSGHWNHLEQRCREVVMCFVNYTVVLKSDRKCVKFLKHTEQLHDFD